MNEEQAGEVLDYMTGLAREMLICGANLERIQLMIRLTANRYGLTELSVFLLSTDMQISARTKAGDYVSRQISIPPAGIHLEQLKNLNDLSYRIIKEKPLPSELMHLLKTVGQADSYPEAGILAGQVLGMICLNFLFGGTWLDALAVAVVTAALHILLEIFSKSGIAHIVSNAICMWTADSLAALLVHIGLGEQYPVVVITVSMLVIPGIPLVNAVRNILCGNEMNGILQLIKAVLETLSLAAGTYISILMFGGSGIW